MFSLDQDAKVVAKGLLGKYIVRKHRNKILRYIVVETEAYTGPHDKACHAYKGRTKRTEVMYKKAGHWYVYLCYGVHWMLNLVTGPAEYPAAVLIRGIVQVDDVGRPTSNISGPGRVTKALGIDGKMNGVSAGTTSGLWIEDRGERIQPKDITTTPRIGIAYAEEWAAKPLRFVLKAAGADN